MRYISTKLPLSLLRFIAPTLLIFLSFGFVTAVFSQSTNFTFQGTLSNGGAAANGSYDMQFKLFDSLAGSTQIGSTLTRTPVAVANGGFAVSLDFGAAAFPGADRFLEISVRVVGGGSYTTLSPRSQLAASPYAIRALTVTGPITGSSGTAMLSVSNAQNGIVNASPVNLPPSALLGNETSTVDTAAGVIGVANSNGGIGIIGITNGVGGGQDLQPTGVLAISTGATGPTRGIDAEISSPNGTAIKAKAPLGGTIFQGTNGSQDAFDVAANGDVVIGKDVTAGGNGLVSGDLTAGNIASNNNLSVAGTLTVQVVNSLSGNLNMGSTGITTTGNVVFGTVNIGNLPSGGNAPLCVDSAGANIIRVCSSSLRYKTDVRSFTGGLEIINRLRPISFTWKENGTHDLGLGAEDVAKVEPRLTFRNSKGEIEGVKYSQLNIVLINAIKAQQAQIDRQQIQINALIKLVNRQRRRPMRRSSR